MNVLSDARTTTFDHASDLALHRAYSSSEWRIIPVLAGLWMLAWVDRANIAFAKLQMLSDLHFSEAVYGLGAGLFFLGYILFAVPAAMLQQRLGAKRIISAIAIGWGAVSISMMFVTNTTGFYFLRFLLGVCEAGFYPGAILYLNLWFASKRRTRNFSIFHSAAICSTVAVGLSGGFVLEHMSGLASIAGWRWMFLVQAVPTVLLGCVVWLMLPDGPATASWLSDEERRLIQADLEHDGKHSFAGGHSQGPVLANAATWVLIAVYFCTLTTTSALSFFLPTILRDAGFGGYAAIGNAVAAICMLGAVGNIAFSTYAGRRSDVRLHCASASMACVASLLLLVFVWHSSRVATFLTLVIALGGAGAGVSLFWQIPVRYLTASSAALGISFINSVANMAGFLTPWLTGYVREVTGTYKSGFVTVACAQAIGAAILLWVLPRVTRKRLPAVDK